MPFSYFLLLMHSDSSVKGTTKERQKHLFDWNITAVICSIFGFIYDMTKCLALFSPMKKYTEIQKKEVLKVNILGNKGKIYICI